MWTIWYNEQSYLPTSHHISCWSVWASHHPRCWHGYSMFLFDINLDHKIYIQIQFTKIKTHWFVCQRWERQAYKSMWSKCTLFVVNASHTSIFPSWNKCTQEVSNPVNKSSILQFFKKIYSHVHLAIKYTYMMNFIIHCILYIYAKINFYLCYRI